MRACVADNGRECCASDSAPGPTNTILPITFNFPLIAPSGGAEGPECALFVVNVGAGRPPAIDVYLSRFLLIFKGFHRTLVPTARKPLVRHCPPGRGRQTRTGHGFHAST